MRENAKKHNKNIPLKINICFELNVMMAVHFINFDIKAQHTILLNFIQESEKHTKLNVTKVRVYK